MSNQPNFLLWQGHRAGGKEYAVDVVYLGFNKILNSVRLERPEQHFHRQNWDSKQS